MIGYGKVWEKGGVKDDFSGFGFDDYVVIFIDRGIIGRGLGFVGDIIVLDI